MRRQQPKIHSNDLMKNIPIGTTFKMTVFSKTCGNKLAIVGTKIISSFIFSHCFILVDVTPEPMPGTRDARRRYTLDGMPSAPRKSVAAFDYVLFTTYIKYKSLLSSITRDSVL